MVGKARLLSCQASLSIGPIEDVGNIVSGKACLLSNAGELAGIEIRHKPSPAIEAIQLVVVGIIRKACRRVHVIGIAGCQGVSGVLGNIIHGLPCHGGIDNPTVRQGGKSIAHGSVQVRLQGFLPILCVGGGKISGEETAHNALIGRHGFLVIAIQVLITFLVSLHGIADAADVAVICVVGASHSVLHLRDKSGNRLPRLLGAGEGRLQEAVIIRRYLAVVNLSVRQVHEVVRDAQGIGEPIHFVSQNLLFLTGCLRHFGGGADDFRLLASSEKL